MDEPTAGRGTRQAPCLLSQLLPASGCRRNRPVPALLSCPPKTDQDLLCAAPLFLLSQIHCTAGQKQRAQSPCREPGWFPKSNHDFIVQNSLCTNTSAGPKRHQSTQQRTQADFRAAFSMRQTPSTPTHGTWWTFYQTSLNSLRLFSKSEEESPAIMVPTFIFWTSSRRMLLPVSLSEPLVSQGHHLQRHRNTGTSVHL